MLTLPGLPGPKFPWVYRVILLWMLLAAAGAPLTSGCASVDNAQLPQQTTDVYRVAFSALDWAASGGPWILVTRTINVPDDAPLLDHLPPGIRASFEQENSQSREIPTQEFPDGTFQAVHPEALEGLGGGGALEYWRAFRVSYPGYEGILRFSSVGYSPDSLRVAVRVNYGCGPRCGTSHLVILRREEPGWELEQSKLLLVF
ncbi:MAG: hypothetical protein HKO65_14635 [Gemmatimonadetes bacterium]|nr:hypothetical protein [Gemmatimonadota bacterium]NNM06325.1 hypothetical protein [Gemmatimonadota bacterium]